MRSDSAGLRLAHARAFLRPPRRAGEPCKVARDGRSAEVG